MNVDVTVMGGPKTVIQCEPATGYGKKAQEMAGYIKDLIGVPHSIPMISGELRIRADGIQQATLDVEIPEELVVSWDDVIRIATKAKDPTWKDVMRLAAALNLPEEPKE